MLEMRAGSPLSQAYTVAGLYSGRSSSDRSIEMMSRPGLRVIVEAHRKTRRKEHNMTATKKILTAVASVGALTALVAFIRNRRCSAVEE